MRNWRYNLFISLEIAEEGNRRSRLVDMFIMAMILLNVGAVILETVPSLAAVYGDWFRRFEIFSVTIFTVEYLLRIWTCTEDQQYAGAAVGRLKFVRTPMALIDLIAILPFYLPFIMPIDLRFLRALRMLRIFRMLKFARYSEALRVFGRVLRDKKEELIITLSAILVLLVLIASTMYYLERDLQPEAFGSIPAALWWGVVSLTTVGYGDVYPMTMLGKVFGGIVSLLGIGVFALPAGIIASGFSQAVKREKEIHPDLCPHCGKALHDA